MNKKKNFFSPLGSIYSQTAVIYSLRKLRPEWVDAAIRIRRSSDDALKYVFYNNGILDMSSPIGDFPTISTASTLSSWIGVDDAYVTDWYGQNPTGGYSTNYIMSNGVTTSQPQIISGGNFLTKGGKPAILFTTVRQDVLGELTILPTMNNGNTFAFTWVGSKEPTGDTRVFSSRTGASFGGIYMHCNDSTAGICTLTDGATFTNANYNSFPVTTNDQRLLTGLFSPTYIDAYYNGVQQSGNVVTHGWANNIFRIADDRTSSVSFNGYMQEIIVYANQALRVPIESDVNNFYNIY